MKKLLFLVPLLVSPVLAEERTLTPEQMEQLSKEGELDESTPDRPANLPDLTKGDPVPPGGKFPPPTWTLGPTGIVATFAGKFQGDQLQVQSALKGSPAEGKLQWGDVLVGMNGTKFEAGGDLAMLIGKAIIEAELPENEGRITFQVWRDRNFTARSGKQNVAAVDIEKLINEARDDNSLYDWKPEEERAKEVTKMGFDKFPIDPETFDVELKLRTFPAYSDTAPYNCPKTERILEDAYKVLEKKFIVDPEVKGSGRGGMLEAVALISSGKPEHRKLVREWVRGPHAKQWHPPTTPAGTMFEPGYRGYKGFQSWHHGFTGLNCALYYEATGDEFVLPALRKYAIDAAMGQSGHGSWGHTFAYPSFNGGKLHGMNPGYGALNAAGNRCFFLITLAQKLGIEHPEIDLAVERAHRFFGSYVDQGAIPYGDHAPAATDDSNGKNTGVAFSMKLLGDKHGAKYFAMMSSHCAFTRRGGHGHDYHGNWSSWAASLCGPEVRAYNERNLRWRRTLCRMFDGSFVYHSPTGYKTLRDPTATEVLHQAVIYKQTLITGKDPDEDLYPTPREMKQLISSARGQFNDPWLQELDGTPWRDRATDEVFDLLDIFKPKARGQVAAELATRYNSGEKEILPRLVALLGNGMPRFRDGAVRALGACGRDAVLENLSNITQLLQDPEDFVRISAVKVIWQHTRDEKTQLAMLDATLDEPKAIAPNSVRNSTQSALFASETVLADKPFEAGFEEEHVRKALEHLILLDPVHGSFMASRLEPWTKDTVVRLAGPLTEAAEEEQLADQMFANRSAPARALLDKFHYREGVEATADRLRRQAAIPRNIRPFVGFKRPLMDPEVVRKQPAAFTGLVDEMAVVLTDNPNTELVKKVDKDAIVMPLIEAFELVSAEKKPISFPSIADDVRVLFEEELDAADGTGAKLKLCREELSNPEERNHFRKMAAMDFLAETLVADALSDLLPYFRHDYWRLREHARATAAELVTIGGGDTLAGLFASAETGDAVGILAVFALGDSDQGLAVAKSAIGHGAAPVRAEALRTLAAIQGPDAIPAVIAHLDGARDTGELLGCEDALLTFREDPKAAAMIRDSLIESMPGADPVVRPHLYFILGRLGDATSIEFLDKAAQTDSLSELREIVHALSYSPNRKADQVLLRIARTDKESAKIVGEQSVRRLVLGPKGFADLSNAERMDFAEPMLKLDMDGKLIKFLGQVHDARALRALMYCLEKGVNNAAESLVTNAEGIDKGSMSTTDNKIAVKALKDVMEYMEVVHLRGGPAAHMDKDDKYVEWKALQARAGKAMLKLHQPEKAPIPEFDPLLLD